MSTVNVRNEAKHLLTDCGVPSNLSGFDSIVEAMCLLHEGESLHNITKPNGLYGLIAETLGTTRPRVERNIRHASTYFSKSDLAKRVNYKITNSSMLGLLMESLNERLETHRKQAADAIALRASSSAGQCTSLRCANTQCAYNNPADNHCCNSATIFISSKGSCNSFQFMDEEV